MKVFFCKVDGGNFGDDMNEWFWDELFPDHTEISPGTTLFGIGSILWRQNFINKNRVVVMGSGSGYGVVPSEVPPGTQIGFVRGPRTARLLGLSADHAITDPAAMVPTFDRFHNVRKAGEIVFIPHVGTAKLNVNWERISERAGVSYVSPAGNSEAVIRRLASAKLVLAESLHGAIIADAFRVPFVPVSISPTFNKHKWKDWSDSLEMDLEFFECLARMKQTRQFLAQMKKKLSRRPGPKGPSTADTSPDNGTRVAAIVSQDEKNRARLWVSRLAPAIEMMLTQDLKRAAQFPGFMSDVGILRSRQAKITARVNEMRDRLAA